VAAVVATCLAGATSDTTICACPSANYTGNGIVCTSLV
jgi:hypothetical protein